MPIRCGWDELVQADENTRAIVTDGLMQLVDVIAQQFGGKRHDLAKRQALVALSTMFGALTLARLVTDPALTNLLLRDAAKQVIVAR
jgi:TetR/AcrR family transcriptional regulator, transcriptional repressor for nem operon